MNEPVSTLPLGDVAVTGVSVTLPTNAPAGMPLPLAERPASVATIELSAIVELPASAFAPASVRAPGTWLPPPSRQVPAGCEGIVCAMQSLGRSRYSLNPGPGYSSSPASFFSSGVLGPVGSQLTLSPNSVSPAESLASEVAASGATVGELAKLSLE